MDPAPPGGPAGVVAIDRCSSAVVMQQVYARPLFPRNLGRPPAGSLHMTATVAPLDSKRLLDDLKKLVTKVEADLLARSGNREVPEIGARLQSEYDRARAVMANPPYITPKDPGLRDRYRDRFATCHMKYSLAVPFMEHIFKLCVPGGFTGQITANSFMKREFGKKLIEKFFPVTDLAHVIDTSGAYIPGHGTPTVILFGRQRKPVADTVRAVVGIRGEPTTPDDSARGLVWTKDLPLQ